jgi:hypothetical protein
MEITNRSLPECRREIARDTSTAYYPFRSRTEEIHAVHEIEMKKTRVTVNGLYLTVIYTYLYAHMRRMQVTFAITCKK